jgi:hypothetical protein
MLEIIKQSLESGQEVLISGFGKFYVKEKTAIIQPLNIIQIIERVFVISVAYLI